MIALLANAKEKHYRVWEYLARTGETDKAFVVAKLFGEEEKEKLDNFLYCYACCQASVDYCKEIGQDNYMDSYPKFCKHCPLFKQDYICSKSESLFQQWRVAATIDKRKRLAKQIFRTVWKEKEEKDESN